MRKSSLITDRKEKPRQEKWRNWCSQTPLRVRLPNANYQLEADTDRGGIRALSKCQLPSFNRIVLATRDWSWGKQGEPCWQSITDKQHNQAQCKNGFAIWAKDDQCTMHIQISSQSWLNYPYYCSELLCWYCSFEYGKLLNQITPS